MADNPYQLYLYVGPAVPSLSSGVSVVDLTPEDDTPQAALDQLDASGLTAADLRTRALFLFDPSVGLAALYAYAAVCGFASRLIDYSDLTAVYTAQITRQVLAKNADAGRPSEPLDAVQVGERHLEPYVGYVDVTGDVDAEALSTLRYARQVFLRPGQRELSAVFELFTLAASLRARGSADRFPTLVFADPDLTRELEHGTDLEQLRRAGAELRRSRRVDDRSQTVDKVALGERSLRLVAAAQLPVEQVLQQLGSQQDVDTSYWRCPRPDRHTNGDANPSCRVEDNTLRCFRCDIEAVDPLRLVMDCHNVSPDEAADWLLRTGG